jgi:two-component system, response regulator YesN
MDYRIKEILAKVEQDFSRPLKVSLLAASINLSVSRFQHLFKKEVQISFIKYINNLRLEKARELLETTHFRVKGIRFAVGIKNEAHFLHNFREKFGATPKNYRKSYIPRAKINIK